MLGDEIGEFCSPVKSPGTAHELVGDYVTGVPHSNVGPRGDFVSTDYVGGDFVSNPGGTPPKTTSLHVVFRRSHA